MKKSLLTIVLAFSFVLGGAALAPTVSEAHGYVASPGSRAFFGSSAGDNLNTTAQHRTASWDYYITKNGWNPNQPLDIKNFDKIASIDGKQEVPNKVVKQTINIPTDRKGYHVIYAVWGIGDTVNAFYQAIDVNIQ